VPDKTPSTLDSEARALSIAEVVAAFEVNTSGVSKLLNFDREVLDHAVRGVEDLHKRLVAGGFENGALNAHNTLLSLRNIKNNDSLLPRYRIIFNQGIVLLVSYFGAAVQEIFKIGVQARLQLDDGGSSLMGEELKLSFLDIRKRGWNLNDIAADLLVDKKDLTFQDMRSIAQAFRQYVGVDIERDETTNDIIAAQACRHVIVHAGHQVTSRMLNQLRDAKPRRLKSTLALGETVQFTPEEVELVATSMRTYVSMVAERTKARV
jgi:hypothetical protein